MRESPPLRDWQTWYRVCALARCAESVRRELRAFAHERFLTYLRRLGGDLDPGACVDPDTAWHLFETHLQVKATREGKRYKDWLFARVEAGRDDSAGVVAAGASLIVRSVVREYVRHERPQARMRSLDAPLSDAFGHRLTLEDLLAGPDDTAGAVHAREREAWAQRLGAESFAALDRRGRVVLTAKALGLRLTHPSVLRAAGAQKSALSEQYRNWVLRMAEDVRERWQTSLDGDLTRVALQAIHHAQGMALDWAAAERKCRCLFKCMEG